MLLVVHAWMTQSVACCLLESNLVQLFHSYLMSDVDQRSQQVVYISETSSLWTIVPWLDPTVYCHTDLDQLLCFSLKNSVKHTKHAGLDRWPCIIICQLFPLLPSSILHELEMALSETMTLLCLVLVQAKQTLPLLTRTIVRPTKMTRLSTVIHLFYSYSRFQKWTSKLTSPRLNERMKVPSPWLEAIEIP